MIIYFLKNILLLGIFYMLYTLFLKNRKTFRWNRIYLVFTSLLALILPFLDGISFQEASGTNPANQVLDITLDTISIYASTVKATELDFGKFIFGIYALGLLWGLLRVALGLVVIRRIRQSAGIEKFGNQTVYFSDQIESLFSFNQQIFIPFSFKDKAVLTTILQHEMAHVQMMHSRDKILFSLLQAIYWFNPFIYLFHKELELIHEFEADQMSTKEIETDDYVQNLLQTIAYNQTPTILVHQFFHHPLKSRITMLYKKSGNTLLQKGIVSFLTCLVVLFTLYLQSCAQNKTSDKSGKYNIRTYQQDTILLEMPDGNVEQRIVERRPDTVYDAVDVMPEFYGGTTAVTKYIADHLQYPAPEAKNKIEGKVMINFTISKEGSIENVKALRTPPGGANLAKEAIRVVEGMPKWKPGTLDGKPVSVQFSLPVDFRLK